MVGVQGLGGYKSEGFGFRARVWVWRQGLGVESPCPYLAARGDWVSILLTDKFSKRPSHPHHDSTDYIRTCP